MSNGLPLINKQTKLVISQGVQPAYCEKTNTLTVPPEYEQIAKLIISDPKILETFNDPFVRHLVNELWA